MVQFGIMRNKLLARPRRRNGMLGFVGEKIESLTPSPDKESFWNACASITGHCEGFGITRTLFEAATASRVKKTCYFEKSMPPNAPALSPEVDYHIQSEQLLLCSFQSVVKRVLAHARSLVMMSNEFLLGRGVDGQISTANLMSGNLPSVSGTCKRQSLKSNRGVCFAAIHGNDAPTTRIAPNLEFSRCHAML